MNLAFVSGCPWNTAISFEVNRSVLNKPNVEANGLVFWGFLVSFVYGLVVGSFDGDRYITMMEDQARQAKQQLDKTGRIRVIVQDNGPVHTSKKVKAKWAEWEAQGLYFFFLPKYCSELNPIETEWHQLKTHELKGQMFDHELDLAYAVIDGIDARAEAGDYDAERFRFPSQLAS